MTATSAGTEAPGDTDVTRWTRLHIFLHWLVVVLIALQFLDGEWMTEAFEAKLSVGIATGAASLFGLLHVTTGFTIFIAVAARVLDRFTQGRPPHPPAEPGWAQNLARVTQTLLYVTVLAMPVAGTWAWFASDRDIAWLHGVGAKVLLALLALHVAGALANHFWFKTDVLRRMLPGHGR